MKIAVCGSMAFHKSLIEIKNRLEELGHEVFLPHTEYQDFHELRKNDAEKWFNLKPQFIKEHFENIKKSDAILVLNYDKNGVKNYIGGSSFLEMGIAFDLNKRIFLLNPAPNNMPYTEEIEVIKPVIINEDFTKIK